jgi:putative transcriptional regulator
LNRASEAEVSDAVPAFAELTDAGELVRLGGPVSPEAVVALGDFDDPTEASTGVVGPLGVLDPDLPHGSLRRVRVYAGYAGWAPGQLEDEIEQDAWIVAPASPDDPFSEDDLWAAALQRRGGPYALLATMPADPSLN